MRNSCYYFRIFAENAIGQSEPLESEQPIEAKPAFGVPSRPTGPLAITDIQAKGCTISWAPPSSDGGSRISAYVVEAREARRTTWYQVDIVDPTENKLKISDLVESNSYYFRVSAKNSMGIGEPLETDTPVVIKRGAGVPETPVPLLVSDIQSDSCVLEWKAPTWTGGEPLKGYLLEMRIGDARNAEWTKVSEISPELKCYQVKNLSEGNEYYFRISAFNTIGHSVPLVLNRPVVPKKKLTPPSPPTGPVTALTCNKDSITIQWGPPKHDGGAPLTRYIVTYREVNKPTYSRAAIVDPETFTCQISNLVENSDYHFRIVAENFIGASDHLQTSEPIKAKSPYNVPDKPEGPLGVTHLTANSATVTWKKPLNDGGSPITGYLIKRRDIKRPVWVKCGRVGPDVNSVMVKELAEGCEYAIQIFAENSEGLSEPLDSSDPIAPKKPKGPPSTPASFECIGVDAAEVTLQWEAPLNDGGAPVKSYSLEMCEKKRGAPIKWSKVKDNLSSIDTSYTVRGLTQSLDYLFRITATNECGESEAKALDKAVSPKKKVQAPKTPNGPIRVISTDESSLAIGWGQPDESNPPSNYLIELRDALKANWTTVATVGPLANNYKLTGLNENSEYYIRIRAQNEANLTSQPLETESFVKVVSPYQVPSAPRDLKVTPTGKDKVKVEFKVSENNGGLDIRNYVIEKRDANRVTWTKAGKAKATDSESVECEVDELNPGASYWFRVVAENSKGRSEVCEATSVVKLEKEAEKPSKPLDVTVTKQKKPGSALIEWTAPLYDGNDKLNEYVLEHWSSDSSEWKVLNKCVPQETSYLATGLSETATHK